MSRNDPHEPVTVTDKRRIDPETGQVREATAGPAPEQGSEPAAPAQPVDNAEEDKAAELIADLQRVQADFANYRKRALRDQQVSAERAKGSVVSQLLPILDDLDRARSHGDLESGPLKAVSDKLLDTLEGLGLKGFGDEGDEFDPELHEAVQHEGDGSTPVIGTVMRRGYRLGEQVLRHAMVGVIDTDESPDTADQESAPPAAAPDGPAES